MNAEATAEWKALPRIARIYSVYVLGLLIFYLALPAISYLIFWGALPKIGLSVIYGFLLEPAISLRFLLLLTGQPPIRSSPLALGFFSIIVDFSAAVYLVSNDLCSIRNRIISLNLDLYLRRFLAGLPRDSE